MFDKIRKAVTWVFAGMIGTAAADGGAYMVRAWDSAFEAAANDANQLKQVQNAFTGYLVLQTVALGTAAVVGITHFYKYKNRQYRMPILNANHDQLEEMRNRNLRPGG